MSTVTEIKRAIESLSPSEREELEQAIWPDWDKLTSDNPPRVREKLAQAAKGKFLPGNRSDIEKILSSLK